MKSKLPFDTKNQVAVREYLTSLVTKEEILENSSFIYSSESPIHKDSLDSIIRYGGLSVTELSEQYRRVDGIIRIAIESNIPLSESHQNYLISMKNLVSDRIEKLTNQTDVMENARYMIDSLENQLVYKDDPITFGVDHTKPIGLTEAVGVAEILDRDKYITANGLLEAMTIIVAPENPFGDEEALRHFKDGTKERFKNVIKFECHHHDEGFGDLPAIQCMKYIKDYLRNAYSDIPEVLDKIDDAFNEFADEIEELLDSYRIDITQETGFHPNPFNIYNLTPFPVATRTISRSFYDLANANTDEEVLECLMTIGKIQFALEKMDVVMEKGGNPIRKGIRKIGEVENKIGHTAKKIGKEASATRKELKKVTTDPISKFIMGEFERYKKADQNERRNMLAKGRIDGIPMKICRAIKKGILMLLGSAVVGGVAAGPIGGAVLAGISLVVMYAADKHMDRKEKQKLINELEDELRIVEEKIDDSRGDDNKQNKYELLRIKNKLTREIARLKMGGNYNAG